MMWGDEMNRYKAALIDFLISITANNNGSAIKLYLKHQYKQAILCTTYKGLKVFECKKTDWTNYSYSLICLAVDIFNRYISENETCDGRNINYTILRDMFQNRVKESLSALLNNINIDLITSLSYEKYEKNNVKNAVIVLTIDDICPLILFDEIHQYSFTSENIHGIRKLIQMLDDKQCLVMRKKGKDYFVVGIAKAAETLKLIRCELRAFGEWIIRIPKANADEKETDSFFDFVQYKQSQYLICNHFEIDDINKLLSICKIKEKYKILENPNILIQMSTVIHNIIKLGSGTIIIFSKSRDAFDGLKKYNRMFPLDISLENNIDILNNLVKIDGAVICDFNCYLIGYGAILDGSAVARANLQRGSRYNSTLNFIKNNENIAFGVVISDDGMVDIISKK